jgi:hypothetical protein
MSEIAAWPVSESSAGQKLAHRWRSMSGADKNVWTPPFTRALPTEKGSVTNGYPMLPPDLKRLDTHGIPEDKSEIRLFGVVRNESLRMPYFLDYYRAWALCAFSSSTTIHKTKRQSSC